MSLPHPAIIAFGDTFAQDFPLILAVGREPSSHEDEVHGLGSYDFRTSPRCGFWNQSYAAVGETVGLTSRTLKELCVQRRASPLIYADALPITIKNVVTEKRVLRDGVPAEAIAAHVTHIFSHDEVMARVALVIMSGLESPSFTGAVSKFETACESRKIPMISVPFFYGTNAGKIREQLAGDGESRIRTVMERFQA